MALEFIMQFPQQAFTVGQELVFSFMEKKVLSVLIKDLEGEHLSRDYRLAVLFRF